METMTIAEFLNFLYLGGGSIAILSYLFEKWIWFTSKPSEAKRLIMVGASTGLTILAYLALTYLPADVIAKAEPFFQIIFANVVLLFTSKVVHFFDKRKV